MGLNAMSSVRRYFPSLCVKQVVARILTARDHNRKSVLMYAASAGNSAVFAKVFRAIELAFSTQEYEVRHHLSYHNPLPYECQSFKCTCSIMFRPKQNAGIDNPSEMSMIYAHIW